MVDSLSIGPVPSEEECAQVGEDNYMERAQSECARFIALIRKAMGPEPEGARLKIQHCPHDFGTYLDVVCAFDTDNPAAVEYAYRCESDAPTTWPESDPMDDAQKEGGRVESPKEGQ